MQAAEVKFPASQPIDLQSFRNLPTTKNNEIMDFITLQKALIENSAQQLMMP